MQKRVKWILDVVGDLYIFYFPLYLNLVLLYKNNLVKILKTRFTILFETIN